MVAFDLFVEPFDGDAVEGGEIGIEHDGLAAQADDVLLRGANQGDLGERRIFVLGSAGGFALPIATAAGRGRPGSKQPKNPDHVTSCSYLLTAWMACKTFSGVKGNSLRRAPVAL